MTGLADVLRDVANGRPGALAQLYDATAPQLYALALRMLGTRGAADAALSDTFASVQDHADRAAASGLRPMTWLLSETRASCLARLAAGHKAPAPEALPEDETGAQADAWLATLSRKHADALRRAWLDGASYAELADWFHRPIESVRGWFRAGLAPLVDDEEMSTEDALAIEHALGLLTPDEARAFDEALAVDGGLRQRHARWADLFADMAAALEPVDPDPEVRARSLQAAAPVPDPDTTLPPVDLEPRRPESRGLGHLLDRLGLVPAMLTGLVAALLVLWLVRLLTAPGPAGAEVAARIASPDSPLEIAAVFRPGLQELALRREAGEAPPGRALELWLVTPDGTAESLGLLPDSGTVTLALSAARVTAMATGDTVLAVSSEPFSGSPSGRPSGGFIAEGALAAR